MGRVACGGSGVAGVAPHFPNTQPPTFLPMPEEGGPSLFLVRRCWLAIDVWSIELLSIGRRDSVPCAVAVQGVTSGSTEPAPRGVEKRGEEEYRSCAGRDCRVCMSIPETEMRDSCEAWRRIDGRICTGGERRSLGSNSSGDMTKEGSGVESEDSSTSSGIAA